MEKNIMKAGLILLLLALLSSCGKEKKYTETVDGLFDTEHVLVGYAENRADFQKNVEIYRNEMERLHKLYTAYEDYENINNIRKINESAGVKPVKVDRDIIELLKFSVKLNKEVDDSVNIGAGAIIEMVEKNEAEKLKETDKKKCTDIDGILIDEKESTVFLREKCMKLNVGAVAKGFAVEKAAQKLEKAGADSFLISAGGNVRIIGKRKNVKKDSEVTDLKSCKEEYCVGIALPLYNNEALDKDSPYRKGKNYLAKVSGAGLSVVTTGNYQRYAVKDGEIQGHIVNLKTLRRENRFASVTVISRDSGLADFMSTTLFLLPYEAGLDLVEKMDGVDAVWAFSDGEIKNSSGLKEGENFVKYKFK